MEAFPFLGEVHKYSTSFKVRKWKECDRRCTHHERMWMGWMTDTARTRAVRCSVHCDDALTDKGQSTHVFVLMCSVWKTVMVVRSSLVPVV